MEFVPYEKFKDVEFIAEGGFSLIVEICDGLRPPVVTNAPEGYIELMKECWHPDSNKRPTVVLDLYPGESINVGL
ncbi:hypothetical protein C1645_818733 [Glomus cerebriforme]|uniref:Serine-threonine/tyrosine-protein kinase catalytic domain-containing protein n=1 Tax=Glomus cerebriforme TaxID=658196 RepID=A0A397T9F8_9GLOM|nr:hypothetical protein C1645_818733 [Glomus cerebriforme]